jgi:hypothetical protein
MLEIKQEQELQTHRNPPAAEEKEKFNVCGLRPRCEFRKINSKIHIYGRT